MNKSEKESYENWIKWTKECDKEGIPIPNRAIPPLTRNQWTFAEFLLKNHEEVGKIGNMELIFESVRRYLKS